MSFGQNPFSVVAFGESSQQEDATFALTGVAGTGAVTAAEGKAGASVALTGVSATGTIGTPTEQGRVTHGLTGVSSTASLGTIAITGGAGTVISVTGVSATCITDDPSVTGDEIVPSGDATLTITGVAGTSALGTAVGKAGSINVPTGQEATGSIGSVTTASKSVHTPTSVASTGVLGTITPVCQAVVVPTGVQGTFTIGDETINAVQFDYESIKENYSRARTVYLSSHSSNTNTSYVRAA